MTLALLFTLLLQNQEISNGSFRDWKEGSPTGWTVLEGATNSSGSEPSRYTPGEEGGIILSGNKKTGRWFALRQKVSIGRTKSNRITFRARTSGLKREGNQYTNHFISVGSFTSSGKPLNTTYRNLTSTEWTEGEIITPPSEELSMIEITLFLSITGQLEISKIAMTPLEPVDSFDVLVRNMDLYYSYFHHKNVSWRNIWPSFRDREGSFLDRITPMLSKLEDGHIWILPPEGKKIPVWRPETNHNYNLYSVAGKLAQRKQVGRNNIVGTTKEGFGYIAIGSLVGPEKTFQTLEEEIAARMDTPGFIIDLRSNGGGYEGNGIRLARYFCDKERVYAKAQYRSNQKHDSFSTPVERVISPRKGATYTRPVIVLIGQACISSGEGMALMFRSFPHATLLGQPTRGASGNPQPVHLPNGIQVWYSRWVAQNAEGIPFEGKGIHPDIVIHHKGKGDPTFDAAVALLRQKVGK